MTDPDVEAYLDRFPDCRACGGRGLVMYGDPRDPELIEDTCRACWGSGRSITNEQARLELAILRRSPVAALTNAKETPSCLSR